MEHMGKHYECGSFTEGEDPGLVEWALREGILCRHGPSNRLVLSALVDTLRRK